MDWSRLLSWDRVLTVCLPEVFVTEIKATENQIRQQWHEKRQSSKNYLIDNISDEMAQYMKEKRLGK